MPKFRVHVQQYVEETATVIIEADTPEAAAAKYNDAPHDFEPDWSDGDNIIDREAYSVTDKRGDILWER